MPLPQVRLPQESLWSWLLEMMTLMLATIRQRQSLQ
jgi:hypothetical protein